MRQLPWAYGQVTQHARERSRGSGEVRVPVPVGRVERETEGLLRRENAAAPACEAESGGPGRGISGFSVHAEG